jgi:hypothetical protein
MDFKQKVNEELEEKIAKMQSQHKTPLRRSVDSKISTASRTTEDADRAHQIRAVFFIELDELSGMAWILIR